MAGVVARRAAAAALVGLALAGTATATSWDALDLYARVLGQVERSALAPPTPTELVYASLRGLAREVDPHAQFFDPPAWARLQAEAAGSFVGVGVLARPDACGARVEEVLPDGPADRAGLRAGECLTAVDDVPLRGLPQARIDELLRGDDGKEAVVLVQGADDAPRRVVVLRARYADPGVSMVPVAAGRTVIRLRAFRDGTAAALRRVVAAHPTGLVLDLRGNPGGRLDQAVAVADLFLGGGVIVETEGRGPGASRRYEAAAGADDYLGPLVVLVDGETASAAEIVAGSLQAARRARLVGSPTWGKGSVQSLFRYEDGSALKLTDATWRLANGRSPTRAAPLQPDLVVAAAPGDPARALRAHLEALTAVSEAERARLLAELDALAAARPPPAERAPGPDVALEQALADLGAP